MAKVGMASQGMLVVEGQSKSAFTGIHNKENSVPRNGEEDKSHLQLLGPQEQSAHLHATEQLTTVTYRSKHLVRLSGLEASPNLDGKLARIESHLEEESGKFEVTFLDDRTRPPVPVPARYMIKPEHFSHACEFCLKTSASRGVSKLRMCGRCKTARYCNTLCQELDWARHYAPDCMLYSLVRGCDTPLQRACLGDIAEVRRLVEEEGADVNKASTHGPTPLCTAAWFGHLLVVQYLVDRGADVNKARATSFTPLCAAAMWGFLSIVHYLVEHGADKVKARDDGATALHLAAQGNHLEVVQYLVEQGVDTDKAANSGGTALHEASRRGHVKVVRYLIRQGADKDKPRVDGLTALHFAAKGGHLAVAEYLVEQGADINKASSDSETPLYMAAQEGYLFMVRYLVEKGVDMTKADINGVTPLEAALSGGFTEVAAYLQKAYRYLARSRADQVAPSTGTANDDATTTATATFRINHLVRLGGFHKTGLDGKLVRVQSDIIAATGKFKVGVIDDRARPPRFVVPAQQMLIKPENMFHACEYCCATAAEGGKLLMCGRCMTAQYCHKDCQRKGWAQHKQWDCIRFNISRSTVPDTPLHQNKDDEITKALRQFISGSTFSSVEIRLEPRAKVGLVSARDRESGCRAGEMAQRIHSI